MCKAKGVMRSQSSLRFFDLPAELRNIVYEKVFVTEDIVIELLSRDMEDATALLATCSQIFFEASPRFKASCIAHLRFLQKEFDVVREKWLQPHHYSDVLAMILSKQAYEEARCIETCMNRICRVFHALPALEERLAARTP